MEAEARRRTTTRAAIHPTVQGQQENHANGAFSCPYSTIIGSVHFLGFSNHRETWMNLFFPCAF